MKSYDWPSCQNCAEVHYDELETLRMHNEYLAQEIEKLAEKVNYLRGNRSHLMSVIEDREKRIEHLLEKLNFMRGEDRGV